MSSVHVVLAGGGTAGHVEPALMVDAKDHERHVMVRCELRCGGCDTGVLDR